MSANMNPDEMSELRRTTQMRVEELVDRVKKFHEQAAAVYGAEKSKVSEDEVGMMLDHLIEHERRIADRLERYKQDAPAEVLETWFKYTPEVPIESLADKIEFDASQGRQEIAEMAAQLSDTVIAIYDSVTESSAVDKVQEAMKALKEFEEREKVYALRSTEKE